MSPDFVGDDIGFDVSPGLDFPYTPGEDYYDYKNYFEELNRVSPDELDRQLGEAYKAAGLTLPDSEKTLLFDTLKKAISTPAGIAALGTGLYALSGGNQPKIGGYQGTVPQKTLVREQLAQPAYQPYTGQATMGRRFFTGSQYVNPSEAEAARTAAKEQAAAYKAPIAPPAAQSPLATAKQEEKYNPLLSAQNLIASEKQKGFGTTGPSYEVTDAQRLVENLNRSKQEDSGLTPELESRMEKLFGKNVSNEGISGIYKTLNKTPYGEYPKQELSEEQQRIISALTIPGTESPSEIRQRKLDIPINAGPKPIESNQIYLDSEIRATPPVIEPSIQDRQMNDDIINSLTGLAPIQPTPPSLVDVPNYSTKPGGAYQGGIMGLAKGRYLRGSTDGMADEIPSSIDGKQPAALSHGEFVVPADVVSHLGNGNSDAGADQLYKMMDRIRKARTGNKEQGKRIAPEKFMPGGIAKYASGGIASFQTGGTTETALTRTASSSPYGATQSATLAPWASGYVTDYLSKAQALASEPYQAYQGPLTAGVSPLQQQAYQAAGQIDPNAKFGMADLEQYMNPYTQLALQPQLDELRRQAQISQQNLQGQFTKAGAFGGGRETLARTENIRNLGQLQAGVIGKGYENAFNQAMNQYNVGRGQRLADLSAVAGLGAQQRGIEQEGITALQKQFEQERQFPYTQVQFQREMIGNLPIGTTAVTPNLSGIQELGLTGEQVAKVYDILKKIPGFGG